VSKCNSLFFDEKKGSRNATGGIVSFPFSRRQRIQISSARACWIARKRSQVSKFVCTSHGVWPQAFDLSPLVVTGRHQRFQLSGWSELALQPLRDKEGQDVRTAQFTLGLGEIID